MEEKTLAKRYPNGPYKGILYEQRTLTGPRTYITRVFLLTEGEYLGEGIYRFVLPLTYEPSAVVEGALTPKEAEWRVARPLRALLFGYSIGCYMRNVEYRPHEAILDVWIKTYNAEVIAITVEGRIVDKSKLTL
ncbi:MAG: hypothetical protein WDN10_04050 [bacterium]